MSTETRLTKRDGDTAEKLQQRPFVTPAVDIYENGDELLLVADLPGVAKNDVAIHFDKGQLAIEGHRTGATNGSALSTEPHRSPASRRRWPRRSTFATRWSGCSPCIRRAAGASPRTMRRCSAGSPASWPSRSRMPSCTSAPRS